MAVIVVSLTAGINRLREECEHLSSEKASSDVSVRPHHCLMTVYASGGDFYWVGFKNEKAAQKELDKMHRLEEISLLGEPDFYLRGRP
jgi:hypothetical protein